MEKNCRNCKWFNGGKCLNLDQDISADTVGVEVQYVEQGYFAEAIKENVDYDKIISLVVNELIQNDMIKKVQARDLNKLFKTIDKDSIIEEIEEELNDGLASAVMCLGDNFKGISSVAINEPSEFYCSSWE